MTTDQKIVELEAAVRALQVDLGEAKAEVARAQATADEAKEIACLGALNPVERTAAEMKMVSKPEMFDGETLPWRELSEVFEVFAGSSFPPMAAAMANAARSTRPVLVKNMDEQGKEISRQLGYWLVQSCRGQALDIVLNAGRLEGLEAWRQLHLKYDPQAAGRFTKQLVFLLSWDFSGDVVSELESFEYELGRYEEVSGEVMTDAIKIGVVLRQLPESPLRRHMIGYATRSRGWHDFKEELQWTDTMWSEEHGAEPMEGVAFDEEDDAKGSKGNKGRKGSGKSVKGKSGKDKEKSPEKGPKCWKSGDFGQTVASCTEREEGAAQSVEPKPEKSLDAFWLAALTMDQNAAVQQVYDLLVENGVDDEKLLGEFRKLGADVTSKSRKIVLGMDSCAATTVAPRDVAPDYPVHENEMSSKGEGYRTANGGWVVDEGTKELVGSMESADGKKRVRGIRARVAAVSRALASVAEMVDAGHTVVFAKSGSYAKQEETGVVTPFIRRNNVFEIELDVMPYKEAQHIIEKSIPAGFAGQAKRL